MEVKDTSKLDTLLVPVRVDLGEARSYPQLNSRLFEPTGYLFQNLDVRKGYIVESGGIHQDNIPAPVRIETPDWLYRFRPGSQPGTYHGSRLRLPSCTVHKLRMTQSGIQFCTDCLTELLPAFAGPITLMECVTSKMARNFV